MHADKLLARDDLLTHRAAWRTQGRCVVFTNGCFDGLHRGHVEYLQEAKALGDVLVVALNGDDSVRQLKGPQRPLICQQDRIALLCALQDVDYVTVFDDPSVRDLVADVVPDILVKGGDYTVAQIVGGDIVEAAGGRVVALCHMAGRSTSSLAPTHRQD